MTSSSCHTCVAPGTKSAGISPKALSRIDWALQHSGGSQPSKGDEPGHSGLGRAWLAAAPNLREREREGR